MRIATAITAFLASASIGCDNVTGPATTNDLVGRWNASEYLVRSTANTAQSVDLLNMGLGVSLTFSATTLSETFFLLRVGEQQTVTGNYTINGDQLTFSNPIDGTVTFVVRLFGGGNMLELTSGAEFDFSGDGVGDPATATVTLVKS